MVRYAGDFEKAPKIGRLSKPHEISQEYSPGQSPSLLWIWLTRPRNLGSCRPPSFVVNFPPQKTPLWSAPTKSTTRIGFVGMSSCVQNNWPREDRPWIDKAMAPEKFGGFPAAKTHLCSASRKLVLANNFPVCRAESNSFYRVENMDRVKMGHFSKYRN